VSEILSTVIINIFYDCNDKGIHEVRWLFKNVMRKILEIYNLTFGTIILISFILFLILEFIFYILSFCILKNLLFSFYIDASETSGQH
jgi:hypothetical protein